MACSKSDKDTEWPALSDVACVTTDGRHPKNVQAKSKDSNCVNGRDSSKEKSKESVNSNAGTRKKKNNKVVWQPLHIETQPYRKKGTGRYTHEFTKSTESDKNHRSRFEHSNNSENARGHPRNWGFKGKRGRVYTNHPSHQEEDTIPSETQLSSGIIINGVTFFPQTFSDATRKNFLKRQMEYYFSDSNLVSDVYLRLKMDNLGFVPLNIFLNFPRIMELTRDINVLTNAVEESNKLELSHHNYQLYVRRIVDPLGWKIRNPYTSDIKIPFEDPYLTVIPFCVTPENSILNTAESISEPLSETNLTAGAESPIENCSQSQSENNSVFPDEVNSNHTAVVEVTSIALPSEFEKTVEPVIHQLESLSLNGNVSLPLSTLVDAQYVPNFNGESSDTVSPVTASPSEYEIELSGVYIDSKAINNDCDYYPHPAFTESVEQVNGCRFFPGAVYNDVIFYENNELSSQGPVYYMVNSRETLSTSSDNSNAEVLHLSPEPSR